jgi:beta-lactamase class A
VAHKIGTDLGVYADAAIVYAPKPFILVILSREAVAQEAQGVLPAISRLVWEQQTS